MNVDPLTSEPTAAHERRYMALRGYRKKTKDYEKVLSAERSRRFGETSHVPRIQLLAHIAGQSATAYATGHTMLPIRRVVARPGADDLHGAEASHAISRKKGMLMPRKDVLVCLSCLEADSGGGRAAGYRREHHFLGGNWCLEHRCGLFRVVADDPLSQLPRHWRDRGKLEAAETYVSALDPGGWFERYLQISTGLLARPRPASMYAFQKALASEAIATGVRKAMQGSKPNLSDRLLDFVPRAWADAHLPGFRLKRPGGEFARLDAMVRQHRQVWPGEAYAIAMSTLYSSAEEALKVLAEADPVHQPIIPAAPVVKRLGATFWQGDAYKIYVECRGSFREMAKRVGMAETYVASAMRHAGLPGLQKNGMGARWNAVIRFESGASLVEACRIEGVPLDELEDILRICATRVSAAARRSGFGSKVTDADDNAAEDQLSAVVV